jgi:hypothetical protein
VDACAHASSPNFNGGGILVASGQDSQGSWKLWVERGPNGVIFGRDAVTRSGGGGGSSSGNCAGFVAPLGFTEGDSSGSTSSGGTSHFRSVEGAVTLAATVVRISLSAGGHVDIKPQGGNTGFGRAFYMGHADGYINDIEAFDAHGALVGRTTPDKQYEQWMYSHQH